MNYSNHLSIGGAVKTHKEKSVATNLNSLEFRRFVNNLDSAPFEVGIIPPGFEHRADKISDLFYGTPTLDWLICWANNVSDPFQQLNVGDRIKIVSN